MERGLALGPVCSMRLLINDHAQQFIMEDLIEVYLRTVLKVKGLANLGDSPVLTYYHVIEVQVPPS